MKEAVFLSVVAGFAGMLLLNVFFPHLIMTIYFRQYAPGIITAVFINLPLTIYILQAIWKTRKLNLNRFILAIVIGGLIGLMLVFLLLKIGEFLTI